MDSYGWMPFLWCGLGLLGTAIMVRKNAAIPGISVMSAILTIPHALVFGPIWLLLSLAGHKVKECPFCKSAIRADATVCAKCTRSLPE